jgi:cytidine deaminase
MDINFNEIYKKAYDVNKPKQLTNTSSAGTIGAALLTETGNIYTGVCVDTRGSMGFCAEYAAAGAMISVGESHVIAMIAVHSSGKIYSPCGKCREFIRQMNDENMKTLVMVEKDTIVTIDELLPYSNN